MAPANQKHYGRQCQDLAIDLQLTDIAKMGKTTGYPLYNYFYDAEIKSIVETMYKYDFNLIRRLKSDFDFEFEMPRSTGCKDGTTIVNDA